MESQIFTTLLDQLKQLKLSKDKFYFLKNAASSYYFFNGEQLCQICLCFPHSTDKKDAVKFLEGRIASDISAETAAQIIRSASFSRDRLGILQILVGHVNGLEEQQEQKVMVSAFDFYIDKDQAWDILSKQCEAFGGTMPDLPEPGLNSGMENRTPVPAPVLQQIVHEEAVDVAAGQLEAAKKLSIFDLPIMKEMNFLRKEFPSMEQAVFEEVQRRRQAGHTFVIPSRIMSITANLKPGRRLVVGDEVIPMMDEFDEFPHPTLPDVVPELVEHDVGRNDFSIKEDAMESCSSDDSVSKSKLVGLFSRSPRQPSRPDLVYESGTSAMEEKFYTADEKSSFAEAQALVGRVASSSVNQSANTEAYITSQFNVSQSVPRIETPPINLNQSKPSQLNDLTVSIGNDRNTSQTQPYGLRTISYSANQSPAKGGEENREKFGLENGDLEDIKDDRIPLRSPLDHRLRRSASDRDKFYRRRDYRRPYKLHYDIFQFNPRDHDTCATSKQVTEIPTDSITVRMDNDSANHTNSTMTLNDVYKNWENDIQSDSANMDTVDSPEMEMFETWEEVKPAAVPVEVSKDSCVAAPETEKQKNIQHSNENKFRKFTPLSKVPAPPSFVPFPSFKSPLHKRLAERLYAEPERQTAAKTNVETLEKLEQSDNMKIREPLQQFTPEQGQLSTEQPQLKQQQISQHQQYHHEQQNNQQIQQPEQQQHQAMYQEQQIQENQQKPRIPETQQVQQQRPLKSPEQVLAVRPPSSKLLQYRLEARRSWLDARLQSYKNAATLDGEERPSSAAELTSPTGRRAFGRPPPPSAGRNSSRRATAEICNWRQPSSATAAQLGAAANGVNRGSCSGSFAGGGGSYEVLVNSNSQLSSTSAIDSSSEDLLRSTMSTPRRRVTADLFAVTLSQPVTPRLDTVQDGGQNADNNQLRPTSRTNVGNDQRMSAKSKENGDNYDVIERQPSQNTPVRDISRPKVTFAIPPQPLVNGDVNEKKTYPKSTLIISDLKDDPEEGVPMTGYKVRYRALFSKPTVPRPMSLENRDGKYQLNFGNYYRPGLYYYAS